MDRLRNFSLGTLMNGALGAIGLGLATVATILMLGLQELRIKGPLYNDIAAGKDLVADILPPPAYAIEAYLTAALMLRADNDDARKALIAAMADRERELNERMAFWTATPYAATIARELLGEGNEAAQAFFKVVNERLIPALNAGDQTGADAAFRVAEKHYLRHRAAVDRTVTATNAYNDRVELRAGERDHGVVIEAALVVAGGCPAAGGHGRRAAPIGGHAGARRNQRPDPGGRRRGGCGHPHAPARQRDRQLVAGLGQLALSGYSRLPPERDSRPDASPGDDGRGARPDHHLHE